jgi:hypothetical protein
MVAFICKRAISTASLRSVCEKAETKETAQEGDIDAKVQVFQ